MPMKNVYSCAIAVLAFCGCGLKPSISGVEDIGKQLIANGIVVESTETLPQPESRYIRFDETLALNGPELRVEIIRINDERVYKNFARAGAIIAIGEVAAEQRFPGRPDLYMSKPYVIIVRQEPQKGQVQAALEKVLTFDE